MSHLSGKRQRICIFGLISKHPGRNRGGTAVCIRRLAEFFARKGLQVDLLTSKLAEDHILSSGLDSAVNIRQTHVKSKLALFWVLFRHVMGNGPDIVLALDSRASLIASWLTCLPMVRTRVWASFHSQLNRKNKRILNQVVRRSTGIIVVSRGLGDDISLLTGLTPERIHVLYNLVVTSEIEALAKEPVDHPWLTDKISPVLIGVGRLAEEKGFEFLIKALARVREKYPSTRLIILGQGPLLEPLRKLAEQLALGESVSFAGFKNNPWAYMAKADLFVMSSLHEAFGNVLAEALSLGVPVVASNCPHGPAEILQNGSYGKLVPPGDSEAMAEAILTTLGNSLPRTTLIEAAHRFREETAGQKYLETLGLNGEGE